MRTSIHGRWLGIAARGELLGMEKEFTRPCVGASIVVSAENTNLRMGRAGRQSTILSSAVSGAGGTYSASKLGGGT